VRSNPVVETLLHNILIHPPHHIDTRLPFYRLKQAYGELTPVFGRYICEYRLGWSTVRQIFATCQLYDYDTHTWHRFGECGR